MLSKDQIRLEFDKSKMLKEIKKAENYNEWPASHFVTDCSPFVELVRDKCTHLFHGADTPVVFYKGKDSKHKFGLLMQGQHYNKHGHVVFEEWAICYFNNIEGNNAEIYGPLPITEIKKWTRLSNSKTQNPKEPLDDALREAIKPKLIVACDWMKQVMKDKRAERGKSWLKVLKKEDRRLKEWKHDRVESLKQRIESLKGSSGNQSSLRDAKFELRKIESISKEYDSWIKDHFSTDKNAVVKIMGLFINAGEK